MRRINMMLLASGFAFILPALESAKADENMFGYVYGSETLPKGASEAYLWVTHRGGKGAGRYNAEDISIEAEHGFSNRFQAALYVDMLRQHISDVPGYEDLRRGLAFQGVKSELKWSLSSPYTSPIGVALYLEPAYRRFSPGSGEREDDYSLEAKLILQKNFLEDRAVAAVNLSLEQEFEHKPGEEWEHALEAEVSAGVSFRAGKGWSAGLEGRYNSEWIEDTGEQEKWGVFAGPVLHYAAKGWWATLSAQAQLAGGPDRSFSSVRNLDGYTKSELRLKIGAAF